MKTSLRWTLATLAACTAVPAPAPAQAGLPRDLDAEVTRALQLFQVPGMAIAVVKDGKVMLTRGYGVRRMGDPAPVDANTYFQIASNTKAFIRTSLERLSTFSCRTTKLTTESFGIGSERASIR